MVEACMPKQGAGMAYHIRHTVGVCKPPKGAVFKRHGAERLGKRWRRRRHQVSVKQLNSPQSLRLGTLRLTENEKKNRA